MHFLLKCNTLIIFCFILFSCGDVDNAHDAFSNNTKSIPVIILQPFQGLSKEYTQYLYTEISKVFPKVLINNPIEIPKSTYYPERKRYRADKLIFYLKNRTEKGFITIGLTHQDISHTKGKIKDYGIMGLGYMPGNACLISHFRLTNQNRLKQFLKLAIHELGHTQGLPHCPNLNCYMRDAKGKNHFDEESNFCETCKSTLSSKGWNFN